ncbi:MAG: hypothetical protein JWO82_3286 [Akkermansiaceae bacterium]|nr:hypothetical protein [Akkermansiaceae bacterium]
MLFLILLVFLGFTAMVALLLQVVMPRYDTADLDGPPGDWFFSMASPLACYHLLTTRSRSWPGPFIVLALSLGGFAFRLFGDDPSSSHLPWPSSPSSFLSPSQPLLFHFAQACAPLLTAGALMILDRMAPPTPAPSPPPAA